MNCQKIRELIAQYNSNELQKSEAQSLEKHFSCCPGCQTELEKHKNLISGLKKFYTNFNPGAKEDLKFMFPENPVASKTFFLSVFAKVSLAFVFVFCIFAFGVHFFSLSQPQSVMISAIEKPSSNILLHRGTLLALSSHQKIASGVVLKFGAEYKVLAEALVEHLDQAKFLIAPESKFKATPEGFSIDHGGVRLEVIRRKEGKYSVTTPCAVLGVLGTKFDVVTTREFSCVHLIEGRIDLQNGKKNIPLKVGDVCFSPLSSPTVFLASSTKLWDLFIQNKKNLADFPGILLKPRTDLKTQKIASHVFVPGFVASSSQEKPGSTAMVSSDTNNLGPIASASSLSLTSGSVEIPSPPIDPLPETSSTPSSTLENPEEAFGGE